MSFNDRAADWLMDNVIGVFIGFVALAILTVVITAALSGPKDRVCLESVSEPGTGFTSDGKVVFISTEHCVVTAVKREGKWTVLEAK